MELLENIGENVNIVGPKDFIVSAGSVERIVVELVVEVAGKCKGRL